MLILWTIGCCFYYRATAFLTNKTFAFMIITMFVLSPAWMVWSTKARSGYITAFLLSSIVIFLITRRERPIGLKTWACIGALSGLIYFSQPSFALMIFIFIVFALWERKCWNSIASCLIGLISIVILAKVMLLFQRNNDFWQPNFYGGLKDYSFAGLKMRIYGALSQGSKDSASRIIILIWHMLFVAGCLLQVICILKKRFNPWAMVLSVSIITLLGATFFLNKNIYGNRYLLALSVFLALWFGILYFDLYKKNVRFKKIFIVLFSVLIIFGMISSINFRDYYRADSDNAFSKSSETQRILTVINYLHSHGIKYVYCTDYDLFWKLPFLSKEQIISRWTKIERIPGYSKDVDDAFKNGQPVAVVGAVDKKETFEMVNREGNTFVLENQYFVRLSPSKRLIFDTLGFGFELNNSNNK